MDGTAKPVILAQVGHYYFGAVGQYYFGGNSRPSAPAARRGTSAELAVSAEIGSQPLPLA